MHVIVMGPAVELHQETLNRMRPMSAAILLSQHHQCWSRHAGHFQTKKPDTCSCPPMTQCSTQHPHEKCINAKNYLCKWERMGGPATGMTGVLAISSSMLASKRHNDCCMCGHISSQRLSSRTDAVEGSSYCFLVRFCQSPIQALACFLRPLTSSTFPPSFLAPA